MMARTRRTRARKKPRLSRAERSIINLQNLAGSPAARAKAGWGQHRRPEWKGVPKKLLGVYTPDYIVFHKWCRMTGLTKLDALHDILAPLYEKVREMEEKEEMEAKCDEG